MGVDFCGFPKGYLFTGEERKKLFWVLFFFTCLHLSQSSSHDPSNLSELRGDNHIGPISSWQQSRAGQCCFYFSCVPSFIFHPLPTSRPTSWEAPMTNQPHHSSPINQKSPIPAGTLPKVLPNQLARLWFAKSARSASASHYFRSEERRGGKRWKSS